MATCAVFQSFQVLLPSNRITMLYSMTGYGRAEQTIGDKTYLVEVRSLMVNNLI